MKQKAVSVFIIFAMCSIAFSGCTETFASNQPPEISLKVSPSGVIKAEETITFDASATIDRDGDNLIFLWDFDDSDGIQREESIKEPEDHIACLCEVMSGLINGAFGKEFTLSEQRNFFRKHIQPWAEHFFTDLEGAKSAIFYSPVGTIGKLFIKIEEEAFSMDASR